MILRPHIIWVIDQVCDQKDDSQVKEIDHLAFVFCYYVVADLNPSQQDNMPVEESANLVSSFAVMHILGIPNVHVIMN